MLGFGPVWQTLRSAAIDVEPLRRHPDFRRLWLGQALSTLGSEVTTVAIPYQVFALTHSTLAVGAIALVEMVPWLGFGVLGGALADQLDKRRLMLVADAVLALSSAGFAANAALRHPALAALYALVLVAAAFGAVHRTAMRSSIPRLVGVEAIAAGSALENLYYGLATIAGPALAGLAIARFGLVPSYAIDAATFLFSLGMIARIAPIPAHPEADRVSLRAIADGFRYVVRSPVVFSSQLVDFSAMFFGMPNALFPALAQRLRGGAALLGLLFAAPAVGSLLVTLASRPFVRMRRQGLGLLAAVGIWGVAIIGLGLSPGAGVALVCLAVAGGADAVSGILRTALIQTVTPDSMRGRLNGVELVFYSSGPLLGDFEAGAAAAWLGVPVAVVAGGALCLVGSALVALKYRQLPQYRAPGPAG